MFWALAIVASVGYFARESALSKKQQALQRETLRQAAEFEKLIRTLPPKYFLEAFSDYYGIADGVFNDARQLALDHPDQALKALQGGIRHLLRIVACLAAKFDHNPKDTTYAANIMVFRIACDLPEDEKPAISKRLLFSDESVDVDKLYGILDLKSALSTTNKDEEAAIDEEIRPFAMAVPITYLSQEGNYRVLPGAPLAFVERKADLYADTSRLIEWCKNYGDFTRETISKLTSYFKSSSVKGFVSIPLFRRIKEGDGDEETSEDPFAIMNIHCNQAGLLAQGESLVHFEDLIRPFRVMLVKLILSLPAGWEREMPENVG